MKEIMSSNVMVQKRFTMKKMLEIYQAAKKLNGTTYLYSRQKAVEATSLSKLVSFLLTVEPNTTLKIILEGTDVEPQLEQLTKLLTNEASVLGVNRKRLLETSESFQI
ncbi:HPr family phosphocarrier protein [Mesobacillus subterraneus]|jgi:phosphotransferase system HPr-like phosphotransfer protein|uniref:HPr family phosphocarrier protein n=1 Tax=Mesobacillus subterraneus TaxID=285983 RepID=UPI0020401A52|nr:HPr family phosphocarrier protein [Mesobacillus subterraneus]MCM3662868.1 HPr family phosphocarrier protein [Mesobacillus subterraneus]MCM3682956.1 HPr family phosphocarrier protein [Mesobacillus subterraneus]